MFKNYLKTALRNARRSPVNTSINVLGLAIGVACCLMIGLYVRDELSYDQFHENADRLYRLEQTIDEGSLRWSVTSVDHGPALKAQLSSVQETGRLFVRSFLAGAGGVRIDNVSVGFADPTILTMFSFDVLRGNPDDMLAQPDQIVLTRELSERLFGEVDPVGKDVQLNNDDTFTVAGIVDLPENTHLGYFDAMVPFSIVYDHYPWLENNPGASTTRTYALLRSGSRLADVETELPAVTERVRGSRDAEILHLMPITELRLSPKTTGSTGTQGTVNLFVGIAFLILLIACVNYVNLSTAAGVARLREVGMRKTFGAHRGQLISQFLGESIVQAGLAILIGLLLVDAALPFVNNLTDKHLSMDVLETGSGIVTLVLLCLLTGMAAGAYPALYLSRHRPVKILKGSGMDAKGSPFLRRALIVVQFTASIGLITGALAIRKQLDFMGRTNLGFDQEQVMTIPAQTGDDSAINGFLTTLEGLPSVSSVTRFSGNLGSHDWRATMHESGAGDQDEGVNMLFFPADSRFIPTMEMEVIAGHNFLPERNTDSGQDLILNETSVRALGYNKPEDILGKHFSVNYVRDGEVVGVVKDFHLNSLREEIGPLVLAHQKEGLYMTAVKLNTTNLSATIDDLQAAWESTLPEWPFTYEFVDDAFNALYRSEQRTGDLISWFASLAILVACLGLFGLASLVARQRTREVGIRRVLGAETGSILVLLSRTFVVLVMIAFVLAAPLAWVFMTKWLSGFAYHISFPFESLAVAGIVTLLITMTVVGLRAVRAAHANPVDALKQQ